MVLSPLDRAQRVFAAVQRVITDGEEYIVIDFKFGTPKEEYHTQVREYMHLLSEMGHSRVKGYLWFVYSNKIEEVK